MSSSVSVCPHCVEAAEEPIECRRCGWRWYANPKPAAATLVERVAADGETSVLLLKRAVEPGLGAWDLPAGYLEAHESFEQAAVRETREESGLDVRLVSLSGVYHSPMANAVTAVFRAEPTDASASVQMDHESSDHVWVPRADASSWARRMAFPSMASALDDWRTGSRQ